MSEQPLTPSSATPTYQSDQLPILQSPYPGLRPYREDEQGNFFGREADCKILIDKILVNRLTLLFAATGVGKSSLLQAAVIPQLKSPRGENLDVVYYNNWISNPLVSLKKAVRQVLEDSGSWQQAVHYTPEEGETLADFLRFCALFTRQPLIIVLDQFEEFFRYQKGQIGFEDFLEELTKIFTNQSLPVHFVFSMREDFALELDAFKQFVPYSVFNNHYRLDKLNCRQAKKAILLPLKSFGFDFESGLLEKLLDDLLSRELHRSGHSLLGSLNKSVEPPYLQIVCSELWRLGFSNPDKLLHLSTYQESGGAVTLLGNYIYRVLKSFSWEERMLASSAFDHLISRHGTKMPYTPEDLASVIEVSQFELEKVLSKLTSARVLRSKNIEGKIWYELYHDMFSKNIEQWNFLQKEKIRKYNSEKMEKKIFKYGTIISVFVFSTVMSLIWLVNNNSYHIRLDSYEGSNIEIYKGNLKWPDPFFQKRYIYETGYKINDIDLDERFKKESIDSLNNLNAHIISKTNHRDKEYFNGVNGISINSSSKWLWRKKIRNLVINGSLVHQGVPGNKKINNSEVNSVMHSFYMREILKNKKYGSFVKNFIKKADDNLKTEMIKNAGISRNKENANLLVEILKNKSESIDMRKEALNSLSLIGEVKVIEDLKRIISDKSEAYDIRAYSAKTVGKISQPDLKVIEFLMENSGKGQYSLEMQVAHAIANIKKGVLPIVLEEIYKTNDPIKIEYLGRSLARLVDSSFSSLNTNDFLRNSNKKVRIQFVRILRAVGGVESVDQLVNLFDSELDKEVREKILHNLTFFDHPKLLDKMTSLMEHSNIGIRRAALSSIGAMKNHKSIDHLEDFLNDDDAVIVDRSASALSSIGSMKSIDILRNKYYETRHTENSFVFLSNLGKAGSFTSTKHLLSILNSGSKETKDEALTILEKLKSPESVESIIKLKNFSTDESFGKASAALNSLAFSNSIYFSTDRNYSFGSDSYNFEDFNTGHLKSVFGRASDQWKLLDILNLPDSILKNRKLIDISTNLNFDRTIRIKAIESISEIYDNDIIKPLYGLTSDADFYIQSAAYKAINILGNSKLNDKVNYNSDSLNNIKSSINKLPAGDLFLKEKLLRIIEGPESELSGFAYLMAGEISLKEALPIVEDRLYRANNTLNEWRENRDYNKGNFVSKEDYFNAINASSEVEPVSLSYIFYYSYLIALLDPVRGLELLSHETSDVRRGSYMGFAMKSNINHLNYIYSESREYHDNPILQNSVFRAIDLSLQRLEIFGGDREIDELRIWLKKINSKDEFSQKIKSNIRWAVETMEYYKNLEKELHKKYLLFRVWPENPIPVNQPYPDLQ